jgi:colicin import membrane protein
MRNRLRFRSVLLAAGLLFSASGPALAESDLERAERLKAEAKLIREAADARYAADEPQCYQRFQVNRCIKQAKDARLADIRHARELEAEARRIDMAERQRRAEALGVAPQTTAPLEASAPSDIDRNPPPPNPEAERLRAEREQDAAQRAAEAAERQTERDRERAAQRARAEADAAERAEKAARDRARYDDKLRKREAEQQR